MSAPQAEGTRADRLSLDLPLDAAHIVTARLFAGAVARSLGLGEEAADGLRLALTEVCSEAIERRDGGRIAIEVLPDGNEIHVIVAATGVLKQHPDSAEGAFRRMLMEALAPDASFLEERDRSTVRFSV